MIFSSEVTTSHGVVKVFTISDPGEVTQTSPLFELLVQPVQYVIKTK
jgi:hypothetical protein